MNPESSNSDSKAIYKLLIDDSHQKPLLFKDFLRKNQGSTSKKWECVDWKLENWSKALKTDPMKIRLGKRESNTGEPQWESSCSSSFLKFDDLVNWSYGDQTCTSTENEEISSKTHWAYYDYIYMSSLNNVDFLKQQVSWDSFGFVGRDSDKSTLWIGTSGAYTPCHSDSYGCNLVAQVYGKKRWVLFPPSQTEYLYPTRVPYEESSVYSQIDFSNINTDKYPMVKKTTPYVVTLEAGDALFVPKHWWHFVENISFAISINTWIELSSDVDDRLKESVVEYQIGNVSQGTEFPEEITNLLNPNMIDIAAMDSTEVNQIMISRLIKYLKKESSPDVVNPNEDKSDPSSSGENQAKKMKSILPNLESLGATEVPSKPYDQHFTGSNFETVAPPRPSDANQKKKIQDQVLRKILAQSLTDPRVIDIMSTVIKEKICQYKDDIQSNS